MAGYVGLLAPWIGGAGQPTSKGVRSLLAFWAGGAGAGGEAPGGVRSLLAFWMGGAGALPGEVVVIPPIVGGGGGRYLPRTGLTFDQALQEDREIMLIIAAALHVFKVER